jgi:hypothetical protein
MFTSDLLSQMIRFYGNAMQGMMGKYLENNIKAFTDMQAKLQEQVRSGVWRKRHGQPDLWAQFLNFQGPAMQSMMGAYMEQSKKMYAQMQEQLDSQTRNLFSGFQFRLPPPPGFAGDKSEAPAPEPRHRHSQEIIEPPGPRTRRGPCTFPFRFLTHDPIKPAAAQEGRLGQPWLPQGPGRLRTHPHPLRAEGYEISPSYEGSDLVVVNTCGFIDAAVEESLDAIGEALNENGKVIVTGCLGAKGDVVMAAHPQVLAVTGPHATEQVMHAVHKHLPKPHDPFIDLVPPRASSSRPSTTPT